MWKLVILLQGIHSPDENKVYFTKNWQNENAHFVTLVLDVLMKWKNWKEFKNYESMSFREEDSLKTKTLTISSWPRYNNCKMRSIVWMIQENLKMPNQHEVDTYPTFPVNLRYSQNPCGELGGMLNRDQSLRPDIWNPHGILGNVFAGLSASASTPHAGMLNSWDSDVAGSIPVRTGTGKPAAESGEQNRDTILSPRFLWRPSVKNTFNPMEGRSLRNYVADQQRLQISEHHFDTFPTPSSFSWWKIRFKTEVCSRSNFITEAMLWIKEVEMVHSVDDLKSSCSLQGYTPFPDFELLDARLASALNKTIQNFTTRKRSVWRNRKLKKKIDSFA